MRYLILIILLASCSKTACYVCPRTIYHMDYNHIEIAPRTYLNGNYCHWTTDDAYKFEQANRHIDSIGTGLDSIYGECYSPG